MGRLSMRRTQGSGRSRPGAGARAAADSPCRGSCRAARTPRAARPDGRAGRRRDRGSAAVPPSAAPPCRRGPWRGQQSSSVQPSSAQLSSARLSPAQPSPPWAAKLRPRRARRAGRAQRPGRDGAGRDGRRRPRCDAAEALPRRSVGPRDGAAASCCSASITHGSVACHTGCSAGIWLLWPSKLSFVNFWKQKSVVFSDAISVCYSSSQSLRVFQIFFCLVSFLIWRLLVTTCSAVFS